MTPPPSRSVLLVGATGLVGGECLRLLLADPAFGRVVVLARRPPAVAPAPRLETRVVDFDALDADPAVFGVDAIICALGTTIRQAGSQERFRRVDFDYPLRIARLGLEHGARHFLLVSALGADPRSRIFYNRVKGELEVAVLALEYHAVTVVRPSLLLGDRDEFRLGEAVAKRFAFLTPPRYKPVHARDVARTLVEAARAGGDGKRVIESVEIPRGAD